MKSIDKTSMIAFPLISLSWQMMKEKETKPKVVSLVNEQQIIVIMIDVELFFSPFICLPFRLDRFNTHTSHVSIEKA